MIWRAATALMLAVGLCATASHAEPEGTPPGGPATNPPPEISEGRVRFSPANPSAIIAAELAQARIIRDKGAKGVKEAFKYYIADEAMIFTPDAVNARAYWRKTGALPLRAERSPYGVWMSCDASQAIVQGAWAENGSSGYFVSVWQRQEKGDYKWVMTREETAVPAAAAPEMLSARVAKCRPRKARMDGAGADEARKGPPAEPKKPGSARDETLRWRWGGAGDRSFIAEMWTGQAFEEVLKLDFPPAEGKPG